MLLVQVCQSRRGQVVEGPECHSEELGSDSADNGELGVSQVLADTAPSNLQGTGWQTSAHGPNLAGCCFCITHELRTVFTFFRFLKIKRIFVTHANYIISNFSVHK